MAKHEAEGSGKTVAEPTSVWNGMRVAITGGTSGLGKALAVALHDSGAKVAFVARSRARVEDLVRNVPVLHGVVGDVSVKDDIYPISIQLVGALGGLELLINNASALGPIPLAPLADTNCEDLELALRTNLLGPFRLTKALLGSLAASAREGRRAMVLNISSDAAINAYPNWGAYGASKAALHHLSQVWNQELSLQGVRVLSLDPGDMDTPLHALALPDADRSTLKSPASAAREMLATIQNLLLETKSAPQPKNQEAPQ